jgi:Domain of unknown function (DUF4410)
MKRLVFFCALAVFVAVLASWSWKPAAAISVQAASPQQTPDISPQDVPVYVQNFELDVLRPTTPRKPPRNPAEPEPDPAALANHIVDLMATKLVADLRKAGYPAHRLRPGQPRPSSGVEIRGIFVEVDDQNHWRRAVIRTGDDTGQMQAMVAVENLARLPLALYEIAPLPGNDDKPGAVITLSAYLPMQKYDADKSGDEDIFGRAASQIVSDLAAFVQKNAEALQQ